MWLKSSGKIGCIGQKINSLRSLNVWWKYIQLGPSGRLILLLATISARLWIFLKRQQSEDSPMIYVVFGFVGKVVILFPLAKLINKATKIYLKISYCLLLRQRLEFSRWSTRIKHPSTRQITLVKVSRIMVTRDFNGMCTYCLNPMSNVWSLVEIRYINLIFPPIIWSLSM